MRVAAVIPNWNGGRLLPGLAEDLRSQTHGFDETIVVDNGSTDGSERWAEQSGITVIRLGANLGFAAAVNRGAQATTADFLAVLNNDIRLDSRWLERMLRGIRDGSFAVGKVLRASDPSTIDGTFDALSRGGTAWRCGAGRADGPVWFQSRTVLFPPFTAVLLRRRFFIEAGGLDALFESYLEDVEFGLRCASKGYSGWYVPDAVCTHIGSATLGRWNGKTVRLIARNQLILIARHYPPGLVREYGWRIALAQILWGLVALRHGRGGAWLGGMMEGLRLYRRVRQSGSPSVRSVLEESEKEIRQLQADTGHDLYWRLYFALS